MNKRLLILSLAFILTLLCPFVIFGDGVYVFPAYINGTITLNSYQYSDVVSSSYVYANSEDGFTASVPVQSDGSYTLTVNAPENGSERNYTVYAYIILKSGVQFQPGASTSISVVKGATYSQDYTWDLATLNLDASFSNSDWTYLQPYFYSNTLSLYCYPSISKTGNHSLLIPANIDFKWNYGYAYPADSANYDRLDLDKKEFTASPGETVSLTWTGDFPVLNTGTIRGAISYAPLPEGTLDFHCIGSTKSTTVNHDGEFCIENEPAGTSKWVNAYSYFNNYQQVTYWPYYNINPNDPNGCINLAAGGETVLNIAPVPAMIKGRLIITGTETLSNADTSPYIYTTGIYGSSSYGGYAYDHAVNKNTGEYRLYLTPGAWNTGYVGNVSFQNPSSDPAKFYYTYFYFNDYTRTDSFNNQLSLTGGQIIEGNDIKVPVGTVTIEYTSDDGSLVSSPRVDGSMANYDGIGRLLNDCYIYGYGSSVPVQVAQATFVGAAGTYTVNTTANVNGSTVTFAPRKVIVIEGVYTVIQIDGPSLTIESPTPELYTYDTAVTVSGKATDDQSITAITVNGQSVSFQSTGNSNDPNEVSFSVSVPIEAGPNEIQVVATNAAGKTASDTRNVYKDNGAPTLSVTPANGTLTNSSAVTLQGKATDDNQIAKITVNGVVVDFYATNNPNDPHEVYFTKTFNLETGANKFTVIATDNCKRSTTVTNIITRTDELLPNPSFDNGTADWYCITLNESTAKAGFVWDTTDYDTAPASLKTQCTDKGSKYNDIQLFTNRFNLVKDHTYLLTFKAKSSIKFTIPSIKLNQAANPWADYANAYNNLTITDGGWQNYAVIFTANITTANARLTFFLGGALPVGASFHVDTLSLKEIGVNPPPADELLPNPDFDTGAAKWNCSNDASASAYGSLDAVNYDTAPASYRIRCVNNGNTQNSVQLFTMPLNITSGKNYQLTFKAKCDVSFAIPSIKLMMATSPGTPYAAPYSGLSISTAWESYTINFTANTTTADGRITFFLGNALPDGATFNIDSLSFREMP